MLKRIAIVFVPFLVVGLTSSALACPGKEAAKKDKSEVATTSNTKADGEKAEAAKTCDCNNAKAEGESCDKHDKKKKAELVN